MKSFLFSAVVVLATLVMVSCENIGSTTQRQVKESIVGNKWSIDPYLGPGGVRCAIELLPGVDYLEYYAFNSDSTVDCFRGDYFKTGVYTVEGNKVTCLFVEPVGEYDSTTADDGGYNFKEILEYKDNRLYKYDKQTRNKNNEWVSEMSPEYRELYYKNAGRYTRRHHAMGENDY